VRLRAGAAGHCAVEVDLGRGGRSGKEVD
jgi:hypothetical protein